MAMNLSFLSVIMFQCQHTLPEEVSQCVHLVMLIIPKSPPWLILIANMFLRCICYKMQVTDYYLRLQDHHPMLAVRRHVLSSYHAKLLVLIKSHLLELPYFLTYCFHRKIVLLSILILSTKKRS